MAKGVMVKEPLPRSVALLEEVQGRLGPNRLPLLIAIDGAGGVGKSSLASWLAWQLGAPAIYLDLYVIRGSHPLRWRTEDLRRGVNARLIDHAAPLVIEGVMVLDALAAIDRKPDFLVYLERILRLISKTPATAEIKIENGRFSGLSRPNPCCTCVRNGWYTAIPAIPGLPDWPSQPGGSRG